MTTKFKLVRHGKGYHVIGFEGVKNPKNGKAPTYREQCISTHYTWLGGLASAEKAMEKYKEAKLSLSKYTKPDTLAQKIAKETPLALGLAMVCAIAAEAYIKLTG